MNQRFEAIIVKSRSHNEIPSMKGINLSYLFSTPVSRYLLEVV